MADHLAARRQHLGENEVNPITCPICYEEYNDSEGGKPVILTTCGHSVCKSCVIRMGLCNATGGQVSCPKCRAVSQFIDGLVINFSLLQVAIDGRRNTNSGRPCPVHPNKSSCAFCFDCDRWFCPDCLVFQGVAAMKTCKAVMNRLQQSQLQQQQSQLQLQQQQHQQQQQELEDDGETIRSSSGQGDVNEEYSDGLPPGLRTHMMSHSTVSACELGSRIEEIRKELDHEAKALRDILMSKVEASYNNLKTRIGEVQRVEKKYNPTSEEQIECLKQAMKLEELVHLGGHLVQKADFILPTDCATDKMETALLEGAVEAEWTRIRQMVKRRFEEVRRADGTFDVETIADGLVDELKRELICDTCLDTDSPDLLDV